MNLVEPCSCHIIRLDEYRIRQSPYVRVWRNIFHHPIPGLS